jgi:hypothetical protein
LLDIIQVFKAVRDSMGKIVDFTWEMNNKPAVKQNGEVIGESLLQKHPGLVPSGIFAKMIEVTEIGTPHEQDNKLTS